MGFELKSNIEPTKSNYPEIVNTIFASTGNFKLENKIESKYFKTYIIDNYRDSLKPKSVGQSINEILDIGHTTFFDENKIYELELKGSFEKKFLNALSNPFIDEDELLNQAYELKLHLMINHYVSSAWLIDVFSRSVANETIIVNLFNLLSTFDEILITPTIVMMLSFSLQVRSVKVKNNALELLESLILQKRHDAYNLLNQVEQIRPTWLEDYRQSILNKNSALLG